jgi:hypothetical protein
LPPKMHLPNQRVRANLTLADNEATKFWPVYEQYSADFGKINDTRAALIKEYLTFFQLDRRIRMMIDVQPTSQLPQAESQD